MGLDYVELIIATEEKFGIEIADEEGQSLRTVGDLRRLVESKLALSDDKMCLTQRAFHRLRKVFIQKFHLPRLNFRPDTLLENVVPQANRIQLWAELQSSVGATAWLELTRSSSLVTTTTLLTAIIAFGSTGWMMISGWNVYISLFNLLVVTLVVGGSLLFLTRRYQTHLDNQTVRSLAEFLVAKCPESLGLNKDIWTPERIQLAVRHLVIDELGVQESQVKDEANFVHDLGVD